MTPDLSGAVHRCERGAVRSSRSSVPWRPRHGEMRGEGELKRAFKHESSEKLAEVVDTWWLGGVLVETVWCFGGVGRERYTYVGKPCKTLTEELYATARAHVSAAHRTSRVFLAIRSRSKSLASIHTPPIIQGSHVHKLTAVLGAFWWRMHLRHSWHAPCAGNLGERASSH